MVIIMDAGDKKNQQGSWVAGFIKTRRRFLL
jgi:hypothetical protein